MKIAAALALFLTSVVSAAPAPAAAAASYPGGPFQINFIGAAEGQFIQYFYGNGYGSSIYNNLSVSKIRNSGSSTCYFYGVNGSFTIVPGGATVDVGPPQTQTYGYCN